MSQRSLQRIQPTLTGDIVELRPLCAEDQEVLLAAAADGELWNSKLTVVPGPDTVADYIAAALAGRDAGTVMPFVIVLRRTGRVVGCTRFWKIDAVHRKLEIGSTWLSASMQRTGVNTEAKLLLLTHAFEAMDSVRVQFTTDELNERSRAAILRLGAKQEGTVRNERIMPDGRQRNSVRFSIVDSEWPDVKAALGKKMRRAQGERSSSESGPAGALQVLLHGQRIAALGTLDDEGAPFVSMVPFAAVPSLGCLTIHVSGLAAHTGHLLQRPGVSLLVMQAEVAGEPVHALPRVTLAGEATMPIPDSSAWHACRAAYVERFPEAEAMTQLGDFRFVAIRLAHGRHIAGFGAARDVDQDELERALGRSTI